MYSVVCVKVVETFGDIQQLGRVKLSAKWDYRERLTRLIRFVRGFFSTNSTRVPFGIHPETICKGFIVAPTKGTMFECLNLFRMTGSLKNDCEARRCFLVGAIKMCRIGYEPFQGPYYRSGEPLNT
jgi:hypothetical protein